MKDYWTLDELLDLPKGHLMTAYEHGTVIHDGKGYWYKLASEEGKEIQEDIIASSTVPRMPRQDSEKAAGAFK